MKNQYFGDVKDYLTYGLLRLIAHETGLRIGVMWMLTPDRSNGEGEQRAYLGDLARWRGYDPDLFDRLSQVPQPGRRVSLLEEWELIPRARFFYEMIPTGSVERRACFLRMLSSLEDCPLIFFDPDNGIETISCPKSLRSVKHLYWDEIQQTYQHGHSLLIFQHFPRRPRQVYLGEIASALAGRLNLARVDWLSSSQVAFFLAAQPAHLDLVIKAVNAAGEVWRGAVIAGRIEMSTRQPDEIGDNQAESVASGGSIRLRLLPDALAVCRLSPDSPPVQMPASGFFSLTRTHTEVSLVCAPELAPAGARVEAGWRSLEVAGPLAFGLVGILAKLSGVLAEAGVSIFVISTYDTDYLLVKETQLQAAVRALREAGHGVEL